MRLLIVRHGEILSNIKKIYAGRNDEPLTEKGMSQAIEVAAKLKDYAIDALYSSPMYRAVQTANIIGEAIGRDVHFDDAFQELRMGPWEGLSEENIQNLYSEEWRIWQNRPDELRINKRETLDELLERVLRGVKRIYQSLGDRTAVIVTHVAVIRVLLLWHGKKSLSLYKKLHIQNAGVFEINIVSEPKNVPSF